MPNVPEHVNYLKKMFKCLFFWTFFRADVISAIRDLSYPQFPKLVRFCLRFSKFILIKNKDWSIIKILGAINTSIWFPSLVGFGSHDIEAAMDTEITPLAPFPSPAPASHTHCQVIVITMAHLSHKVFIWNFTFSFPECFPGLPHFWT